MNHSVWLFGFIRWWPPALTGSISLISLGWAGSTLVLFRMNHWKNQAQGRTVITHDWWGVGTGRQDKRYTVEESQKSIITND